MTLWHCELIDILCWFLFIFSICLLFWMLLHVQYPVVFFLFLLGSVTWTINKLRCLYSSIFSAILLELKIFFSFKWDRILDPFRPISWHWTNILLFRFKYVPIKMWLRYNYAIVDLSLRNLYFVIFYHITYGRDLILVLIWF